MKTVPSERHSGESRMTPAVLRATFPGIRDSVRELLGKRMDALARKFHEIHDIKVKDEIERLAREYGKLNEPWVFVSR
jgi:hypothetical protein